MCKTCSCPPVPVVGGLGARKHHIRLTDATIVAIIQNLRRIIAHVQDLYKPTDTETQLLEAVTAEVRIWFLLFVLNIPFFLQ
jgi:hypothetical protein